MYAERKIEQAVMTPAIANVANVVSFCTSGKRASGTLITTDTPIDSAIKYKTRQVTLSHAGMMRNSAEKRVASFFRRRRIIRMRSFQASPIPCDGVCPSVLIAALLFRALFV